MTKKLPEKIELYLQIEFISIAVVVTTKLAHVGFEFFIGIKE